MLAALINTRENLVLNSDAGQPVAVRITDGNMRHVLANFMGEGEGETFPDLPRYTLKDLNLLGSSAKSQEKGSALPIAYQQS